MKNCPQCAESIQDAAMKCRFCGFDLNLPTNARGLKAKHHPSYLLYTLVCILLPIAGIILGIVALTKSDPLEKKLGEHALAFSILLMIVYTIIFQLL